MTRERATIKSRTVLTGGALVTRAIYIRKKEIGAGNCSNTFFETLSSWIGDVCWAIFLVQGVS